MRTLLFSIVLLSVACSVLGQLSSGIAWEGTWTNGKRGAGNLYLCTDQATRTVHGSYGNLGLVAGYLISNTFSGYWYEAGYDIPFGPFQLTIADSGSSISGTWSYFVGDNLPANGSFSWTGTKSNSSRPDDLSQCLFPANLASSPQGVYTNESFVCDHSSINWLDSYQPLYGASFNNFGKIQGYSYDGGASLLLSDFYFNDDEDDKARWRPEKFNIGQSYLSLTPDFNGADDDDSIFTSRIVVGRFVTQTTFCGWFWYGFYSHVVTSEPICFERTENYHQDIFACAFTLSDVKQQDHRYDDGYTTALIAQIQDALSQITLPEFYIEVIHGPGNGKKIPDKDIKEVDYVQDVDYVVVCNSATTLSVSLLVASLIAFFTI